MDRAHQPCPALNGVQWRYLAKFDALRLHYSGFDWQRGIERRPVDYAKVSVSTDYSLHGFHQSEHMTGDNAGYYGIAEDGNRVLITDFDFDEVDRRLGTPTDEFTPIRNWSPLKVRHCTEGLNEIIGWLKGNECGTLEGIGLRALALCWMLRPELFPHANTQTAICRQWGIRFKQSLNRQMSALSRLANGLAVPGRMNGERVRGIYRARALAVHQRLRKAKRKSRGR